MLVHTAFADVKFSADEPLCVGRFPVERFGPFFLPSELLRFLCPKDAGFLDRLFVHALILRHAFDSGVFSKLLGGLEKAIFGEGALWALTHSVCQESSKAIEPPTMSESAICSTFYGLIFFRREP